MEKTLLTRTNEPTIELNSSVKKVYKGMTLYYDEVFYLDYEVDEDTGFINKENKVKHYTKSQVDRNIKALKNAYHVAKGAASPIEIINFRNKYQISASTFSIILGFSKNTISNIEHEGVTSLSTGRLIKLCLENKDMLQRYLQMCDEIDDIKKRELSKRLMEEYI
ncbi:transcriptional regulator [Flavobacterium magnum]|uniref:Transcriptional regulator n=1 Tax=Flavobacterium magnum TaxID=2162713 RepID=A0A2S0RHM0_9FLAO|nr:transcriptional regulator [Flavobacterium magnum]AWA31115.1 transcriptional regulator [Flavobacterium magnum]